MSTSVTAAMLVIGDEILSGRTVDVNINHIATSLTEVGIRLIEVRVVADDEEAIISAVNTLRAKVDYVFSSGGIGPTHDDITADCMAKAFGWDIEVHEEARELLLAGYGGDPASLTESRLRMARIPVGASLITNELSWAPGFVCENVHVMAGVPKIFQAMLCEVIPTLRKGAVLQSVSVRVDRGESVIAAPLAGIQSRYPDVGIGSYPFAEEGRYGTNLVARGDNAETLALVEAELQALIPEDPGNR